MAKRRHKQIQKLYDEDYNRLLAGKKSYIYGFGDIWPEIIPFKHLPRKKKKAVKKRWNL